MITGLLDSMDDAAFRNWLKQVDDLMWKMHSCSIHDLPDMNHREMYDKRMSPKRAVGKIFNYARRG